MDSSAPAPSFEKISHEGSALAYWEPLKLTPKHKTVLALYASGLKPGEIATVTGYGNAWVSVIINHPDAQDLIAKLTTDHVLSVAQDVGTMIKGAAKEAFQKNVHLMRNASSERVQQLSAFDILDRAGFKPKEVVQIDPKLDLGDRGALEIASALREIHGETIELPQLETSEGVFANTKSDPIPDFATIEHEEA